MGGQNSIVGFDDSGSNLGSRIDGEFKFGFFAIINGETFHKKGGESRSSATTEGVEKEESLQSRTLVSQFTNTVQDKINNFFSNSVVSTSIIIGSVFLSGNQLFRMEELAISSSSYFVNDSRFQINEYSSWDMFSRSTERKRNFIKIIFL